MRDPYGLFPLDVAHYGRLDDYTALVDYIYQSAIKESIRLGIRRIGATKEPFSFGLVPETKKRFEQVLKKFVTGISATILRGTETEWIKSAEKNDVLVNALFKNSRLTPDQLSEFMDRNLSALETFQKRKVNGMGLSDRVWRLGEQFQQEMEMSIDIGIGDGRSAAQLSRDIRQNLQNPDKLFRRVRDKHGVLQLSKNAAAYHPGQGVYRSSYKNAMRLTRTEINMAYRTADYERYNQLPQIRGIEVVLSNNHPVPDICDDLKGKYPKDFIFRGWHPQCRCHTITILASEADQDKMLDAILSGEDPFSVPITNPVTSPPKGLSDWLSTNKDRIQNWKSNPYFMQDNPEYIKDAMKSAVPKPGTVKSIPVVKKPVASKSVFEKVTEYETEIRNNSKFESSKWWDQNGNEIGSKTGGESSIAFTDSELKTFKDAIFTHNHPSGAKFKKGQMEMIGRSLSSADVLLAMNSNLSEMRAVTPYYNFIIKRPAAGWPDLQEAREIINSINSNLTSENMSLIMKLNKESFTKEELTHWHKVWKEFSKKTGVIYYKERIK